MKNNLTEKTGIVLILISIFIISGCNINENTEKRTFKKIEDIPIEVWNKLSMKRIFFGHKSVGKNIIEGIEELMIEKPEIKLNIMQTNDAADFKSPLLAHSSIGKNRDPESKINAFVKYINNGIGNNADIALFKFCYVDFEKENDIEKIFETYKDNMKELQKRFKKTQFIHVTSPLVSKETGIKPLIKKIIGRKVRTGQKNKYREIYNQNIRKTFIGKEPVFDLAMIESTMSNGEKSTIKFKEDQIPQLAPEYTDDGGHLNKIGRRIVAEQFLILLANHTR